MLSGKKYVSPLLKKRLENALVQSGYIQVKQQLAVEDLQKEVGLILPGIYSSYFQPLLSGIEDVACKEGYNVILCDSDRKWSLERNLLARLMDRGVQNIILDSVCRSEEEEYYEKELLPLVRKRGVLIYMLSRPSRSPEIGSFSIDHYKTAYEAVSYLIERGHRKIVHICGDPTFPHSALRIQGYRMALLDHGIGFDERLLLEGNFTPLSGFATMSELMEKGINVDAVFSANDQMAIGAMKAIYAFAGPDNIAMGEAAGQACVDLLGEEGGQVVCMMGAAGTDPATNRQQGFENIVSQHDNIEIIYKQNTEGWDTAIAMSQMQNVIARFGDDYDFIFCHDDGIYQGVHQALEAAGIDEAESDIYSVGTGCNAAGVAGIRGGYHYGDVLHSAKEEGQLGVQACIDAMDSVIKPGDAVWYKCSALLVTIENVDEFDGIGW